MLPALCRWSPEGNNRCVSLPPELFSPEMNDIDMVARDGGELFIRSLDRLWRLTFPE